MTITIYLEKTDLNNDLLLIEKLDELKDKLMLNRDFFNFFSETNKIKGNLTSNNTENYIQLNIGYTHYLMLCYFTAKKI